MSTPGGDAAVNLIVSEFAGEEPYNGWLEDSSGRVVGRLNQFRFEFTAFTPVTIDERKSLRETGSRQALCLSTTFVGALDERVKWHGATIDLGGYLRGFEGTDTAAYASFSTRASAVDLGLHQHGWSGIASVHVNGDHHADVDLFNRECSILQRFRIDNPQCREITITLGVTGRANADAKAKQLLLEGIYEYGSVYETPVYRKPPSRNRGGSFTSRFFELLGELNADSLILDVGGGKRQIGDPRYINLEYTAHDEPDILGDGTCLPFRSNTFDLVYTAAVLEHVRDPLAMGREIYRVLKPGGVVLAAAAFMQPIHSEGQHFFNLTPYGMDLTFERFEKRKSWVDVGFAFTIDWFVNVLGVRGRAPAEKLDQFLSLAAEIEPHIPPDLGRYAAAGVWFEGVKLP